MENKESKIKFGWYYFCLLIGIAVVWLIVDRITGFEYPQYFYDANEGITQYVGTNVVSQWADFSFFAYQTMIFFALWLLLLFVGYMLKWTKLRRMLTHEATVTFILTNYTITTVAYTIFELTSGNPTFGLYAYNNEAIHNFGTNILAYYVFYIIALIIGFRIETHGKLKAKHITVFILYLLAYYAAVKITGMYCYDIEWYPYVIFDAKILWETYFSAPYDATQAYALLVGIGLVLIFLYYGLLRFFSSMKQKQRAYLFVKEGGDVKPEGYALITGATGGLGRAFVFTLARRGYDMLLTGRDEQKLHDLREEAKAINPSVKVWTFVADLADEGGRYALNSKISAHGFKICLLVNVAGVDIQKGLLEYTQEKIALQCRVNFEAAVSMCRFAIEKKAAELQIINISSVSGIYPMPYFAVYSATKAALTSFSVSLREEMKNANVAVTAILPGAMPTREDIKEQIKGQGLWGKLAAKSPERVAVVSLKAVSKNKRKVIVGFWNKMMRVFTWWIPTSWRLYFIAKRWSKISKDAF